MTFGKQSNGPRVEVESQYDQIAFPHSTTSEVKAVKQNSEQPCAMW